MSRLKGVGIGAGYFSQFHYEAWNRMDEVEIAALAELDETKAIDTSERFGIPKIYREYQEMLIREKPDFVDIITPPATHLEMVQTAAEKGISIICQKPLAPNRDEALQIVDQAERNSVPFMVHENWRFNPWYREIRKLIESQAIGRQLFTLCFRSRMGDGWGKDAYLDRQPYFRDYPRLLVYETGVHFIDTYRYLAGEIRKVYGLLKKLNPVIAGEDSALVIFEFESGSTGIWDANRYNESNHPDPRFTFGEFSVEAEGGTIRLYSDGRLTVQKLGADEIEHVYQFSKRGFSGDCVYLTQKHFVEGLLDGAPFETRGREYLKTLAVQEAVYRSAFSSQPEYVNPIT